MLKNTFIGQKSKTGCLPKSNAQSIFEYLDVGTFTAPRDLSVAHYLAEHTELCHMHKEPHEIYNMQLPIEYYSLRPKDW